MSANGLSIVKFKVFTGNSTLKGWADVYFRALRLTIFECPACIANGKRWVNLPGKPMVDRNGHALRDDRGRVRYAVAAAFDDKDVQHRFSDAAIAALDEFMPGWDR